VRVLFLAPQPFFQERGTPIAVRLALKVLSCTRDYSIDLLTFQEGQDLNIANVSISRIWAPAFLSGVGPGFSIKKVVCDVIFFFYALAKVLRARYRGKPYQLIHAVEESVFIGVLFRLLFGIPYIYDMDSSLALQLTEKLKPLKPLYPIFKTLEQFALRYSIAVIPVCDALAVVAQDGQARDVEVLSDISLSTENADQSTENKINLRQELKLPSSCNIILYVGNLEEYQGVGLLIDAFAEICYQNLDWRLVIIGGNKSHIKNYSDKIKFLKLNNFVILGGTRSVSLLNFYLQQADILASPRTLGNNTPMKIYSYMHSGVPIIATNLSTHTQVLNSSLAFLVEPDKSSFAVGLQKLINDEALRKKLAQNSFEEVEQKYTFEVFSKKLQGIYKRIEVSVDKLS
jgi:glycosyltransferase involved in cell wall biosynthesis